MIEGTVVANHLTGAAAARARELLWPAGLDIESRAA